MAISADCLGFGVYFSLKGTLKAVPFFDDLFGDGVTEAEVTERDGFLKLCHKNWIYGIACFTLIKTKSSDASAGCCSSVIDDDDGDDDDEQAVIYI